MKKAIFPEEKRSLLQGNTIASATPAALLERAPTKIARALVYFRYFGTLNRFEAPKRVGDTRLNSTIPALKNSYGLTFEHLPEKSPNNWGEPYDCTRYRLLESSFALGDKALEQMFNRTAKHQKVTA